MVEPQAMAVGRSSSDASWDGVCLDGQVLDRPFGENLQAVRARVVGCG